MSRTVDRLLRRAAAVDTAFSTRTFGTSKADAAVAAAAAGGAALTTGGSAEAAAASDANQTKSATERSSTL